MTDKPKPLTKAEIELMQSGAVYDHEDVGSWSDRTIATLDALFRYRERTRGFVISTLAASYYTNDIASEEGIE